MAKSHFKKTDPENIQGNIFRMINKQWFLLTSGTIEHFNTMTASWGTMGILWNKPVVFCFVRPQRHTYNFMEASEIFTLSFLGNEHRSILNFCGKYSGKDTDKVAETGLIPYETSSGAVYFEQANLVFECRKIYFSDLDPDNFLNNALFNNYPINDFHRMYVGEIISCLQKTHE